MVFCIITLNLLVWIAVWFLAAWFEWFVDFGDCLIVTCWSLPSRFWVVLGFGCV